MTTPDTSALPSSPGPRPYEERDTLRVVSYNLWQGRAQRELAALTDDNGADVLCVQEAHAATLPARLGDMTLAVATTRNRLGVALYVRTSRFDIEQAGAFQVTRSRHDRLIGGADHRLAAARVADRQTGRRLVLGSFHGTPLTDVNSMRRLQIDDAHRALAELGPGLPAMMAGDYNHPFFLGALRRHLQAQGIALARTAASTYRKEGSLMRGPFDLATVSRFLVTDATPLPQGTSDHTPVLFTLSYTDAIPTSPTEIV